MEYELKLYWNSIEEMQEQLAAAIEREDYQECIRLRDLIEKRKNEPTGRIVPDDEGTHYSDAMDAMFKNGGIKGYIMVSPMDIDDINNPGNLVHINESHEFKPSFTRINHLSAEEINLLKDYIVEYNFQFIIFEIPNHKKQLLEAIASNFCKIESIAYIERTGAPALIKFRCFFG